MDTRSKIISADDARKRLEGQSAEWISGHFDPLLADHVRLIRGRAKPGRLLVVEVTNPSRPLLPQRARAELVAALQKVDYVVMSSGGSSGTPADAGLTQRFVEHLRRRHNQGGAG